MRTLLMVFLCLVAVATEAQAGRPVPQTAGEQLSLAVNETIFRIETHRDTVCPRQQNPAACRTDYGRAISKMHEIETATVEHMMFDSAHPENSQREGRLLAEFEHMLAEFGKKYH